MGFDSQNNLFEQLEAIVNQESGEQTIIKPVVLDLKLDDQMATGIIDNRRLNKRFQSESPVVLRDSSSKVVCKGRLMDISESGIALFSNNDRDIFVGDQLKAEFIGDKNMSPFIANLEVKAVHHDPFTSQQIVRMQFIDKSDFTQKALEKFIQQQS